MRKKLLLIFVMLISFAWICGCSASGSTPASTLDIQVVQYWENGSEESTVSIDLVKGKSYLISEKYNTEFKVKKVTEEYIVIESNQPLSASTDESKGTDMHSNQTKFTCNVGETWYFKTLSYDAGEKYIFCYDGF